MEEDRNKLQTLSEALQKFQDGQYSLPELYALFEC